MLGPEFLQAFKPDSDALLRRMSTLIDDATLELIADEDVIGGAARRAGHINALRMIRDGGPLKKRSDFASSDEWHDQDVTELIRFSCSSEPDAERRGTRGHWARAFASAVVLRAQADEDVRRSDIHLVYPVRQLAESIRRLDAGLEPEAMAALAWFLQLSDVDDLWTFGDPDQRVFTGLGLLSLAVNSRNMISDRAIMELADWLISQEKRGADTEQGSGNFPNHWLFRITFFDLDREQWMAIGAELAAFDVSGPCGDAVRNVGRKLSGRDLMP
jgi:hypothetical protein